ncbi:MAG TPA: LysM peptidoglycan-binding domain-containing protein [Gemmatimonadaceae bacterium]|nr:LysM peptidoglycan-binding domain-containing protein [Gemmatimonadaceae bacterium]
MAAAACAVIAIGAFNPGRATAQQVSNTLPATHTVKRGDTLWDIAKMYLGDPYLWPEIYRNNTDLIEDPHWIYPGELLKLPGGQTARVVAVTPPEPSAPVSPPEAYTPPAGTMVPPSAAPVIVAEAVQPTSNAIVRVGEYVAAPWVDQQGGPRGAGSILQAADIPGIASADHSRMRLYDLVFFAPPVGGVAPEHDLYLAYRLGPLFEGFGQIVIPTGVIEVTRSPRNGEAATGRVVKMFSEVLQGQFLVPYDSSAALVSGTPSPVTNGRSGKIRWVSNEPVLPTTQDYVVVDIAKRDGIQTGDQIELFQERQHPTDGKGLILPEVSIGHARVMRVTPFGASAIIESQEQPKIGDGTAVRVDAKMP